MSCAGKHGPLRGPALAGAPAAIGHYASAHYCCSCFAACLWLNHCIGSRSLIGPRCHAAAIGEPSIVAPGGLSPEDTPQFVLLTHDDGVDAEARGAMLELLKGKKAAQGCPLTATMFTLMDPEGWTCERQGDCLWGPVWCVPCKATGMKPRAIASTLCFLLHGPSPQAVCLQSCASCSLLRGDEAVQSGPGDCGPHHQPRKGAHVCMLGACLHGDACRRWLGRLATVTLKAHHLHTLWLPRCSHLAPQSESNDW